MERFINPKYEHEILTDYPAFVRRIRAGMDDTGMAVLESFLQPAFLEELRSSVERLTPQCYQNGKRKPLIGGDLANTGFYEVAFSDFMIRLANDILEVFNVKLESTDIHPLLGILVGEKGQDSIKGLHFDATYLTIAMPVVMPTAGERDGKFRIWPNVRRFSQSPLEDRLYYRLAKIDILRRMVRNYAINFVPGNLYFFYGFRSYHGTDELDSTQLRANCLINFGGPFFDREKGRRIKYAR